MWTSFRCYIVVCLCECVNKNKCLPFLEIEVKNHAVSYGLCHSICGYMPSVFRKKIALKFFMKSHADKYRRKDYWDGCNFKLIFITVVKFSLLINVAILFHHFTIICHKIINYFLKMLYRKCIRLSLINLKKYDIK